MWIEHKNWYADQSPIRQWSGNMKIDEIEAILEKLANGILICGCFIFYWYRYCFTLMYFNNNNNNNNNTLAFIKRN